MKEYSDYEMERLVQEARTRDLAELERLREENRWLRKQIERIYVHVGSMLPERLETVNRGLHEKAMTVLRETY